MTSLLHNATDAQLSAAVEDNLFALFRAATLLPGSELVEGDRLSYHFTSVANPMFRSVWRARFAPDEVDAQIDFALDWFKARGSSFVAWWTGAATQPADLPERLRARGFEVDYVAAGMAANLHALGEAAPPGDFRIVECADERTLDDWSAALYGAYEEYGMPLSAARMWADATRAFGANGAPWRLYVGYWNGQPVATNLLFNGAGVAGLYCVGTIPEARGKGIGAAITLKPLLDARAEGYQYGVLFASEMGVPLYERLGFWNVGNDVGRYWWENESSPHEA